MKTHTKKLRFFAALSIAASLAFISCSKTEQQELEIQKPVINVMANVIAPGAETVLNTQGLPNTKVSITKGDTWSVQWNQGDKLGGWSSGASSFTEFKMNSFTDDKGKKASFTGSLAENTASRLLYPYDATAGVIVDNKYNVSMVNRICDMNVPFNALSDKNYMISDIRTASNNWDHIPFYNIMSALNVKLKFTNLASDSYLKRIEIKGNGSTIIYNSVNIDLSQRELANVLTDKVAGSVSVVIDNSPKLENDKVYEISTMLIPTTIKTGTGNELNITVYMADGKYKVFTVGSPSSEMNIERGKYYSVSKICDMSGASDYTELLGLGTLDNPFLISSRADLALLATKVNGGTTYSGKYFRVINDIDLGGSSTPYTAIGNGTNWFKGTFDGAGHKITGLYINATTNYQGLFGCIASGAVIKNISVTGDIKTTFDGQEYSHTAGIVGMAEGGVTISSCSYSGSVSIYGAEGAGIVAYINGANALVENCINYATVTSTNGYGGFSHIGGIVGYVKVNGGIINKCINYGDILGVEMSVGGIACSSSSNVYNCMNYGKISGKYNVGGILGGLSKGTIYNSCNFGAVNATGDTSGGIVGYCSATVKNCFNIGKVTAPSKFGGIVGNNNNGTFTDSYYLSTCVGAGATEAGSPLSDEQMKSTNASESSNYFYKVLNSTASALNTGSSAPLYKLSAWTLNAGTYPKLDFTQDANGVVEINSNWKDVASPNFGGGTGVQADPYRISTPGELARLAMLVNSGNDLSATHFILVKDIALSGKQWTAIGNEANPFKGSIDGAGHKISGLYINTTTNYQGLFGHISAGAVVKNISATGDVKTRFESNQDSYTAGIVGRATGSVTISSCSYSGSVTIYGRVGAGIVAHINNKNTRVENCSNYATVISTNGDRTYSFIGGIVGYVDGFTGGDGGYEAGGLINKCINYGEIYGVGNNVAGIVACLYGVGSYIYNSFNYAKVSSSKEKVGGIAGESDSGSSIYNSANFGEVKSLQSYAGGIVGTSSGSLSIENCFNVGSVEANSRFGPITGSYVNHQNCYFLNSSVGASSNNSGISLSLDQMKNNADINPAQSIGGADYTKFLDMLNAWVTTFNATSTVKALVWSQPLGEYPFLKY